MKTAYVKLYGRRLLTSVKHNLKKRDYKEVREWSDSRRPNHFIYYNLLNRIEWKDIHKECRLINNHPMSYILSHKNELSFLVQNEGLSFIPYSFEGINASHIRERYQNFANSADSRDMGIWIVKPPKASSGSHIKLITTEELLDPYQNDIFYNRVIQKYIERPLLLEGRKFDFRIYVLFTQENELYIHPYFTTRHSAHKYNIKDILDITLHLTNITIQKKTTNEINKILLPAERFWEMYEREYGDRFDFIGKVGEMMIKIFDLMRDTMKRYKKGRYYQLFGIDVMMDTSKNIHLIEFNRAPGLDDFDDPVLKKHRDNLIDDIFKLTIDRVFDNKHEDTDFIFLKKY